MITEYFWFFLGLAGLMALQIYFAARQSKTFMAAVRVLRTKGNVAIGLGSRKAFGRKAYVALAMNARGEVVDARMLRGITQFARPRPMPQLTGVSIQDLAGAGAVPGCDHLERAAARQAALTLSTSGGWQPTGGLTTGKENVGTASALRK